MIATMRHDPGACVECIAFDSGGIGVIRNAAFDDGRPVWSDDGSSCFALIGDIPGPEGSARLFECFERHGEGALTQADGAFCLAHYSAARRSLTIANDRYGFVPLYYYADASGFWFASEVKAILKVIEHHAPDWEAYADFFYVGHMLGRKTLFKNVHCLGSGQIVAYRNGALDERTYDDFTRTAPLRPEQVSTGELAARFVDAVRKRLRSDRPNALLLSGGFDSRLILGALLALGTRPKIVALEHATERRGADGKLALIMANHLGLESDFRRTQRDYYLSKACLDAFYIVDGMVPTWELFIGEIYQELRADLGMVWDGMALDVALGGSHQYAGGLAKNVEIFIEKRAERRKLLRRILKPSYFRLLDDSFLRRLRAAIDSIPASENRFRYFLLQNRTRRRIAINPYQLFAAKIRPITPAADRHFFDYVLGIPASLTLDHQLYAKLLKDHFAALTNIPAISGGFFYQFSSTDRAAEPPLSTKKRLKRLIKRVPGVLKLKRALENVRRKPRPCTQAEYELSGLIVRVLDKRRFDRDFYAGERLNRLFARYRDGDMSYHALFAIVFYIELWHLLFIDGDDSIWREFR